jgi:hypothetical protein
MYAEERFKAKIVQKVSLKSGEVILSMRDGATNHGTPRHQHSASLLGV